MIRDTACLTVHLRPCENCIIKYHCGGMSGRSLFVHRRVYQVELLFCPFSGVLSRQAWVSTGDLPIDRQSHFVYYLNR